MNNIGIIIPTYNEEENIEADYVLVSTGRKPYIENLFSPLNTISPDRLKLFNDNGYKRKN